MNQHSNLHPVGFRLESSAHYTCQRRKNERERERELPHSDNYQWTWVWVCVVLEHLFSFFYNGVSWLPVLLTDDHRSGRRNGPSIFETFIEGGRLFWYFISILPLVDGDSEVQNILSCLSSQVLFEDQRLHFSVFIFQECRKDREDLDDRCVDKGAHSQPICGFVTVF